MKKPKVLTMHPTRFISQARLRRLLHTHDALLALAETLEKMTQTFEDFHADVEAALKLGLPVEPGPIWDEIRRRRILRAGISKAG